MTRLKRYKQRRKTRIHLQAPLVTLFVLSLLLAWDGAGIVRMGLLCALLHETGHLLVYRWQWHHWPDLQVSPTGICLLMRGTSMTARQEFFLAAAGPMVNLAACGLVLGFMEQTRYSYTGYWFASTNLLVGGINLLPLPGLDGERILRSFWH